MELWDILDGWGAVASNSLTSVLDEYGSVGQGCYNTSHMVTALAPEEIARIATEAATEKQAIDVVLLDVRKSCTFADFFVVCTGDNDRQIAAIWEEILDMLRLRDVQVLHKEGAGSGWLLADYGSVVVHVFAPEEREYYQIESLWKDAIPVLRIQ